MITVSIIYKNQLKKISANKGDNLLDVLNKNHFFVTANCGGNGKCKKCKVKYLGNYILSCNTTIENDMEIELDDYNSIILNQTLEIKYDILRQRGYGLAIDLGTTTIAYYLIDLENGEQIDRTSELNMQATFGADIITRIKKCNDGNLKDLNLSIINQINNVILNFQSKYKFNKIEKIIFSANNTMLHILGNIDPSPLGVAPFKPVFLERKELGGKDLNILADKVIFLPSVSAYIGSDIVSGLLACDIINKDENLIFIDIGTNGEIILKTNNKLIGCSTAAGPAFEGANIEFGMASVNNAISKIEYFDNKLNIKTIGDEPKGICGSGIVDIIAILFNETIIDESGAFNYNSKSYLRNKLISNKFFITDDIYITQKDIREFQLAKSAIASGIKTVIKEANVDIKNITNLYLAGGFGFYLDIKNALTVGLLPREFKDKITLVGNSSGLGSIMCLVNPRYLKICDEISKKVEVIELSKSLIFNDCFIDNLIFKKI